MTVIYIVNEFEVQISYFWKLSSNNDIEERDNILSVTNFLSEEHNYNIENKPEIILSKDMGYCAPCIYQ